MKKPSSQQTFWHSGFFFFFLPSFLHFFLHLFMDFGGFFSHFLILISHASSSLRPPQLTSGSDGDGGADGGSGSHKPHVFLHDSFFFFLQCLFLHFFAVSTHAGGLGGGGEGLGGDGEGGGGEGEGGGGEGECGGSEGNGGGEGDEVSTVTFKTQAGSSSFVKTRFSLCITFCTV